MLNSPRRLRRLAVPVLLSLVAASCGSDDADQADTSADSPSVTADVSATEATDGPDTTEAPESAESEAADESAVDQVNDAAYPVTIEHRFGSTVIPERPERIVTLNVQWTDAVLAMGETPAAYMLTSTVGETDPYPWQTGLLDGVERIDSAGQIPFEMVSALDPDLILVTFAVAEEADFDLLSDIAPTVAFLSDLEVEPWAEQVKALGEALGEPERAADVIAGVDAQVAELAAELPGLAGKTYTFANLVPGDTIYVIADPDDGASRVFNALGMELDPEIVAIDEGAVGRVQISYEQIGLLQADLVGVLLNGAEPDSIVGLSELPSAESGALIDFTLPDIVGLNTPTPLSVPYLLDLMRPQLELVAGDA